MITKINLPSNQEPVSRYDNVPDGVLREIFFDLLDELGYEIRRWQVGNGTGPHYDLIKKKEE